MLIYKNHPLYRELVVLILFLSIFGSIGAYLGADLNWDLMNYHYYNPYAILNDRIGFDVSPAQVQTYINPLFDFIAYYLISNMPPNSLYTNLILGSIHGVAGYILYKISKIYFNDKVRESYKVFSSILIGLTGAAGFMLIGSTMTAWESSIFVLLSYYFLIKQKNRFSLIFLSGILIGVGVGGKLTNAIYFIGLIVALSLDKSYKSTVITRVSLFSFGALLGLVVSSGYWMWILYSKFESPLFPFFNNIFHSNWANLSAFNDQRFLPKSLQELIFYPFYWVKPNSGLVTELVFRDIRFSTIYVLFTFIIATNLLLKSRIKFDFNEKFLFTFFIISYFVWLFKFSIYRYLLPLENLSGIVIIISLAKILLAFNAGFILRSITILGISGLILVTTISPNWGRFKFSDQSNIGYFRIKNLPELERNSLAIMFGGDAMSFLIPHFDNSVRFVSIKNNFFDIKNSNNMSTLAKSLIESANGKTYIFYMDYQENILGEYLEYLKLVKKKATCQVIHYSINERLNYCELSKEH
jgi:uncharacterized membrane protein (GlpM family)